MSIQSVSPERLIYLAASKLQDPVSRQEFLDEACGPDHALRQRLELLLSVDTEDAHDPLGQALEGLGHASGVLDSQRASRKSTSSGRRLATDQHDEAGDAQIDVSQHRVIGRYKLLEELGRGGMGAVYMAQQTAPVKRKVAVKIIKPGMDSSEVIARFQAERQALALMDHPNIARVLDAGTTGEGRPYFVMELVRGIPITKFCEENKLRLPERLELFVDLCKAVQHAHHKAIIHRDLKPGNILVTLHDGKPVVKVIDFGVAKALNQELTEQTLFTQFSQMIGTPLYMSPEQAVLSGLDVDTRADIYALGVILYELLTGTTPIPRDSIAKLGFEAIRKMITEQEPERPSSRVSTLSARDDSTLTAQKEHQTRLLAKQLCSELDWIVMKALEKDRTRRYETANALAADVQRYIDGDAVEACPPSRVYQLRKFFRRNKPLLTTLAFVFVALLAGAGLAAWQAMEATSERNHANELLKEAKDQRAQALQQQRMSERSLGVARQAIGEFYTDLARRVSGQPGMTERQRELLSKAVQFYHELPEEAFADRSVCVESAIAHRDMAGVLGNLGEYELALEVNGQGKTLLERQFEKTPADYRLATELAESERTEARYYSELGNRSKAIEVAESAIKHARKGAERSPTQFDSQWCLGHCLQNLANTLSDGSEREGTLRREVLEIFTRLDTEENSDAPTRCVHVEAVLNLGELNRRIGQVDQAKILFEQALKLSEVGESSESRSINLRLHRTVLQQRLSKIYEEESIDHSLAELQNAITSARDLAVDYPELPTIRKYTVNLLRLSMDRLARMGLSSLRAGETDQAAYVLELAETCTTYALECDPDEKVALFTGYIIQFLRYELDQLEGNTFAASQHIDLSVRACDEAIHKEPNNPEHFIACVRFLASLPDADVGHLKEYLALVDWAVQSQPTQIDAWLALGAARYRLGDWDGASDALETFLGYTDTCESQLQVEANLFLAMTAMQLGKNNEAQLALARARDLVNHLDGSLGRIDGTEFRIARLSKEASLVIDGPLRDED